MKPLQTIQQAVELPLRVVQQAVGSDVDDAVDRALEPLRNQLADLRERVQQAVSSAVQEAVQPLVSEIANLEVEIHALRNELDEVRQDTTALRNKVTIDEASEG